MIDEPMKHAGPWNIKYVFFKILKDNNQKQQTLAENH